MKMVIVTNVDVEVAEAVTLSDTEVIELLGSKPLEFSEREPTENTTFDSAVLTLIVELVVLLSVGLIE